MRVQITGGQTLDAEWRTCEHTRQRTGAVTQRRSVDRAKARTRRPDSHHPDLHPSRHRSISIDECSQRRLILRYIPYPQRSDSRRRALNPRRRVHRLAHLTFCLVLTAKSLSPPVMSTRNATSKYLLTQQQAPHDCHSLGSPCRHSRQRSRAGGAPRRTAAPYRPPPTLRPSRTLVSIFSAAVCPYCNCRPGRVRRRRGPATPRRGSWRRPRDGGRAVERPLRWVRRKPSCRRTLLLLRICGEVVQDARFAVSQAECCQEATNMFAWSWEICSGGEGVVVGSVMYPSRTQRQGQRARGNACRHSCNTLPFAALAGHRDCYRRTARRRGRCVTRTRSVAHLVSKSMSVALVAAAAFTTCGVADRPGSLRTISSDASTVLSPSCVCAPDTPKICSVHGRRKIWGGLRRKKRGP